MKFHRLRALRSLPEIPLTAIFGTGLFGTIAFAYMMLTRMTLIDGILPKGLLEVLVVGIPAFGLLYAGFWLATGDFAPSEIWTIGSYAITGVVIAGLGVTISLLVFSLSGLGLREAFFLYISTGTEGAFFGVLLGAVRLTDILHQDITASKKRERELQRQNERLDEFAKIVSHDLRNPLNVAQGRIELAQEEYNSEHIDIAAGAVDRSLDLIDDMLELARAGQQVSDMEPVDVANLVQTCWKNVQTVDATIVADIDSTIQADQNRLSQLLENLFRNAVEHGGDDITVRVGELDDGFYVEDDGPGIPEADREDVFEAGYSTSEGGTGFGLSIVKEIVEAHDWEIQVSEGTHGGARFEITGIEITAE